MVMMRNSIMCLLMVLAVAARAQSSTFGEAPMLAARVAAGELPPVEERLPVNPVMIPVVERIGDYGGTWRTALLGGQDTAWLFRTIGYEHLVRVTPDWSEIIPNIAESFEASEDGTEYVFRLRQGMKWSDGRPFTADDIMFWYEDVFSNDELTPVKPAWLRSGGEYVVVEKLDDYTLRFTFSTPNGIFLDDLASTVGNIVTAYPRHYLEQFHSRYNPEGIDGLVREAGSADWVSLFAQKSDIWGNGELPTLNGWMLTTAIGESTTRVVAERNPYYWKVDPEGNQLPYIDSVIYDHVADTEVLVLKGLGGEIDMMDRHLATFDNKALFTDNMERGDYRFFETVPDSMNLMVISFNLTHTDPVKREIFQNKDFRIGLSYAINRQEIIDVVYVGQGEPHQAAPRPESPFYNERLAKQYTEYDPELANEHLDRAGYTERDAQGFRLGPDGRRISLVMEVTEGIGGGYGRQTIDALGLIQESWAAVGVEMHVRVIDRALLDTNVMASEHDVTPWVGSGGMTVIQSPFYYFPFRATPSRYAIRWAQWYQGDPRGEEPPENVKRQMELYDYLKTLVDPDARAEVFKEILEIAADEFYAIGLGLDPNGYGIVRNNFRNVPESMPATFLYHSPAPSNPSQYFIEGGN